MSFLNAALLGGLAAVSIPILIHLFNRRSAKVIDWGAMRFLLDSLLTRKKRIQLEEALLMAARCLLVALLALCVARPFVPPGSNVPWVVVLPLFLLGVAMAAVTTVMWPEKRLRWKLLTVTVLLLGLAGAAIGLERWLNLKRFGTAGRRDIAIVIDGSMSMTLQAGGTTNFDAALREAEKIVNDAGGGTAFSLVLGAPVPQAVIGEPRVNRAEVKAALGELRPVNGRMAAFDCIREAALTLVNGRNPQKDIIVLTDAQDAGWELDRPSRWEALAEGLANFKQKPNLIVRQFPLPASLRNLAITDVKFSRAVVGTDRPVGIEVTVANTGTESVTPAGIALQIGEETLKDSSLGQLLPGAVETVRFTHKFARAGGWVVKATADVQDDLPGDNTWDTVAEVQKRVKVLIVDGAPGGSFMERAGAFAALALAPSSLLSSSVQTDGAAAAGAADLIDPEVKPLSQLLTVESFAEWDAVLLCDVPGLAPSQARALAGFVEAGGGVLIAPGGRSNPAFYNEWRSADGRPVAPLRFQQLVTAPKAAGSEVKVALTTFTHPALRLVADAKQSDLASLVVGRWWRLADNAAQDATVAVGGRLANSDPFFASRRLGQGTVLQLAVALDPAGSNLPSRQAFVALVHEVVYHLVNSGGQRLNLEPAYVANVPISRTRSSSGLRGEYFAAGRNDAPLLSRIDPQVKFDWEQGPPAPGLPADNFSVRWTGSLMAQHTEEYVISADADDSVEVYVDDEQLVGQRRRKDRVDLVAGKPVPIRVEYSEGGGGARVRLHWESQSQRREIIPTEAFLPYLPGEKDGFETKGGEFAAIGPDKLPRTVELIHGRAGTMARLRNAAVPGLYEVTVPESRRGEFPGLLTNAGNLAFTIVPDGTEGTISPLKDEAFLFLQKWLPVVRPTSADEVLAVLAGRQFGEELWKYLAVGALFLFLAETALARWIAVQRQSGAEETIDLESRFEPKKAFQEQVERLRKVA